MLLALRNLFLVKQNNVEDFQTSLILLFVFCVGDCWSASLLRKLCRLDTEKSPATGC